MGVLRSCGCAVLASAAPVIVVVGGTLVWLALPAHHAAGATTPTPTPITYVIPRSAPASPPPPTAAPLTVTWAPPSTPAPTMPPLTYGSPPGPAWSADECSYASAALLTDYNLDTATAQQDGLDTPTGAHYATVASEWSLAASAAQTYCADPGPGLSSQSCNSAPGQFGAAYQTHAADLAAHPENAEWDQRWEGIYTTLTALWQRACPPLT